jgi:sugar/nucleoside kinase (ribokinase family)
MARPSVVAVGDLFLDVSVHGAPGHGARTSVRAGGSSANTAVWAAAVGARSSVIGRVGYDLAGGAVRAAIEGQGVHVLVSTDFERPTGTFVLAGGDRFVDRGANAVVLNEVESDEGVHLLAERFRLACVTLGALGAIAVLDGHEASVALPPVEALDPTGAGDAFAAALLVALCGEATLEEALAEAARCGALAAASPTGWPVVK